MKTYRLDLEFEGTRYRGWQEQKNARSVAGELRRAVEQSGAPEIVELGGAGRTDAGVHAVAQTAHLRLASPVDPERLRHAVNDALPPDIHVLAVRPAPARFHARHHALARSYVYQISRRRTAMAKRFVWWVKRPLDVPAMARAAELLVGRHDFAPFCERPDRQTSTIVVLESATVEEAGALVLVRLVASHFLWKMVRRIVGALVEVGAGELPPSGFAAILAGEGPSPARWTAPPSGLFLERVLYPDEPPLAPLVAPVPVGITGTGTEPGFRGQESAGSKPRDRRTAARGARKPPSKRGPRR
jgi:tRNA pseudouridine38-40 synthase